MAARDGREEEDMGSLRSRERRALGEVVRKIIVNFYSRLHDYTLRFRRRRLCYIVVFVIAKCSRGAEDVLLKREFRRV